jgi:hypothetical protein
MPPLPLYVFMVWCLVKHRDNFTLPLRSRYKTMQAAGDGHTKSWKCRYSHHWTRRCSTWEVYEVSELVAVRHTIDHLSILWLHPRSVYEHKHNLLYKTWTAVLRGGGWRLLKKRQNPRRTCKIKSCIYITTTKTVRSYKTPVLPYRSCRDYSQNLIMSPQRGSIARLTDWLADRQSQSNSDCDFACLYWFLAIRILWHI